jgi:DNA-binding XRE family transcriptional regulator
MQAKRVCLTTWLIRLLKRSTMPFVCGWPDGIRRCSIELGERKANLRNTRNITEVQLAEVLGVSQQTIQAYGVGRRRIPVSALPAVARLLAVPMDDLFGTVSQAARGKRGPCRSSNAA